MALRSTRIPLCLLALVAFLSELPATSAAERRSQSVAAVTVSKASPFRRCHDGPSHAFFDGEVEPSIALDPARDRIVIVYQQDRFPDGAARGIAASFSADRGRSWRRSVLPVGFCAHDP